MQLKGKKIAIFGMGRSGLAALKLANRERAEVYAVNSGEIESWKQKEKVLEIISSDFCLPEENASVHFEKMDLIIISPGIPTTHPGLKKALQKKVPVWSEIEFANQYYDGPLIAVTGTNGKTTTVSFLEDVFKRSHYDAFVGGNIGTPFCELILSERKVDLVILELSSFQLETTYSLHANGAILLNIYPNHGERYQSTQDYAEAKFRITQNMTKENLLIYPSNQGIISDWGEQQVCRKITYSTENAKLIKKELEKDFDLSHMKLVGDHNILNTFCAVEVIKSLSFDQRKLKKAIQMALNEFPGVSHRLQYVKCHELFQVYNDAKSTNWDATLTALEALEDHRNLYLILGGQRRGRGDEISPYIEKLKQSLKKIFLIGEVASDLEKECKENLDTINSGTLEKALEFIRKEEFKGTLLFSPAFPSFDQFSNYQKRGEKFLELLNA